MAVAVTQASQLVIPGRKLRHVTTVTDYFDLITSESLKQGKLRGVVEVPPQIRFLGPKGRTEENEWFASLGLFFGFGQLSGGGLAAPPVEHLNGFTPFDEADGLVIGTAALTDIVGVASVEKCDDEDKIPTGSSVTSRRRVLRRGAGIVAGLASLLVLGKTSAHINGTKPSDCTCAGGWSGYGACHCTNGACHKTQYRLWYYAPYCTYWCFTEYQNTCLRAGCCEWYCPVIIC